MKYNFSGSRKTMRRTLIALVATLAAVASMLASPPATATEPAAAAIAPAPTLLQRDWLVNSDSEQDPGGRDRYAVDGDPGTMWHSQFTPTPTSLPHQITIDVWDDNLVVTGLRYRPRNDGSRNGNIGMYEIRAVRADNGSSDVVASGTFADDDTEKTVLFRPVHASHVRLIALSEAGNRGPWTSAAEINLFGYPIHPLPRSGMTVTADSQHGDYPAGNAVDGDPATAWWTNTSATSLPHTFTIGMNTTRIVSGLRYLPRLDRFEGRIGGYQVHLSVDGATWGDPVAIGSFADDSADKTVVFPPAYARFVRLTALSEAGNRSPRTSAAEIELIGYGYPDLTQSRASWTVSTDSEQPADGLAGYAIDGNPSTAWHSQHAPTNPPLPHRFTIDTHATNIVSGLRYQPRNDGNLNGNIGQYQIHVSADGIAWGSPVATGTFADDATEKSVLFPPSQARFVRLTALTEAGNRGPWTSAAEINLTDNQLSDLQCKSSAPIYTVRSNGSLFQSQHLDPETGLGPVAAQQHLANLGLDARRVAGPDGVVYSAVNNGELRRSRWNGTSWDVFPNGLTYEVIDTNPTWALFTTPNSFNDITVDARGDIYTIEWDEDLQEGNLHWRRYDPATRTLDNRILAITAPFGDYLLAAGPGVIYMRLGDSGIPKFSGSLRRIEYDPDSQRYRYEVMGGDWRGYRRLFSPGGDVLYGIRADTGDLMWHRYNPQTNTWANGIAGNEVVGTRVGTGWQNEYETFAAPDACRLVGTPPFVRPQVTSWPQAPVSLALSENGHLHYSYVDSEGRAIYADAADLTGGTPIRLAAVPGMINLTGTTSIAENEDGRIQVVGTGLDAEVHSNTRTTAPGAPWGTTTSLGGFVTRPSTLVRLRDDRLMVLSVDQRGGFIWTRLQDEVNGPLRWWTCNADRVQPRVDNTSLTVLPTMHDYYLRIIGQDSAGTFHVRSDYEIFPSRDCRRNYYQQADWQSLGGTGFVGPASAVGLEANGSEDQPTLHLQVFATGSDGVVYTQRETSTGFPGTWTPVAGGFTARGATSAVMAPDGLIKVVARGTNGFIYYSSQTAAGSTTFAPWQMIAGTDDTATDPTALAVPGSATWVVAYRDDLDIPRLRRYVPGSPATATAADPFMDIPLIPPA